MKTRRDLERRRLSIRTRTLALALVLLLGVGIAAGSGIGAAASPATLAMSPTPAIGGASATGVIQLAAPAPSGGAMFLVRSSDNRIASVPGSIIVPAGQTKVNFAVSTQPVSSPQDVTIRAWSPSLNAKLSASLTVFPQAPASPPPALSSLLLKASSIVGGTSLTGEVKLSSPAPSGGASISLGSSNASAASVPAAVTIPQGSKEKSFTVSTFNVASSTALTISATYGGVSLSAALTVNPQSTPPPPPPPPPPPSPSPALSSLALNPSTVTGGSPSLGTVKLSAAAPTGGATVSLTSSSGSASVPTTVSVLAGASSATFNISTGTVSAATTAAISASYAGKTLSATLSVKPPSSPPGGGGGGGANVYVASAGSDSNPCTQASPCLSFDRAYRAAKPGDKVQIASGSYGGQSISLDSSKLNGSSDVSFGPAPGAKVTLPNLTVKGSHVAFHDMSITGSLVVGANSKKVAQSDQARNVTLSYISASHVVGNSASNVTINHSSFGPAVDVVSSIRSCYLCAYPPQNWTFDDVYFHDYTRTNTAQHMECMQTYPVIGLTIKNSKFYNCSIMDLFLADGGGYCTTNVTLENNWFDTPGSHGGALNDGYYPLLLRCRAGNSGYPMKIDIRYSSFVDSFNADTPGGYTGTAIGNAATGGLCIPGLAYSHNVMSSRTCGSTDVKAKPGFIDAANFILDLVAGAAAINAGDPADYPSTDIHGHGRPLGARADAGAQEAG